MNIKQRESICILQFFCNLQFLLLACLCAAGVHAPCECQGQDPQPAATNPWRIQTHDSSASFRGLFVVDEHVVWASGSGGTVIRSIDGGNNWMPASPSGTEKLDFRDIHAFDRDRAVVISAGAPARTYQTSDGGKNWRVVFEDKRPEAFFDAMSFWDDKKGIAFSDPIDGRLLLIKTEDGGSHWAEVSQASQPQTLEGEAGFAASGTCLCTMDELVWIGLGGKRAEGQGIGARIMNSDDFGSTWSITETPIRSGEASGIFSIAFANRDHGVAVGGTYTEPDNTSSNICVTDDGGKHWRKPTTNVPSGYRSCVAVRYIGQQAQFICVGRNGSDISTDWGNSWKRLGDEPFHAVAFSKNGKTGIAIGLDGKIGIWK